MKPGEVIVHLIRPRAISDHVARTGVTADELERARRFRFPADAARWLAFRSQLRSLLAEETGTAPLALPILLSSHGKPLLAPPFDALHFNLSHGDDLGLLAISRDGPVGIDLEPFARASGLLGCEASFCHPLEIAALPASPEQRARQLLKIWTAKEAVLKSLGTGLIHPPETLRIAFDATGWTAIPDTSLPALETQRLRPLDELTELGFCAAISTSAAVTSLRIF
ncbi:MAG: 4'-phosphopantetheinyl transferase superfamily protein [Verrucomicrobiota bacterium]